MAIVRLREKAFWVILWASVFWLRGGKGSTCTKGCKSASVCTPMWHRAHFSCGAKYESRFTHAHEAVLLYFWIHDALSSRINRTGGKRTHTNSSHPNHILPRSYRHTRIIEIKWTISNSQWCIGSAVNVSFLHADEESSWDELPPYPKYQNSLQLTCISCLGRSSWPVLLELPSTREYCVKEHESDLIHIQARFRELNLLPIVYQASLTRNTSVWEHCFLVWITMRARIKGLPIPLYQGKIIYCHISVQQLANTVGP